MRTEKSDIYSICGAFVEPHHPNQSKFFGGYFAVRTESNQPRKNVLAMPFNGLLVDGYGMSEILGEISPHELEFNKTYRNSENQIQYNFRKSEGGVWVGEYIANDERIGNGPAAAKIHRDWRDNEMIVSGPFDPEGWAKDIVEQMVNEGMLRVVCED